MRFLFSDGSTMVGDLNGSDTIGQLEVRSGLFKQAMRISASDLLEARLRSPDVGTGLSAHTRDAAAEFGFVLTDESRMVGSIESWADDLIVVKTKGLGRVELQEDRIAQIVAAAEIPLQILSLATSRYRYRREPGWNFEDGMLRCDSAVAATVGNLDLPDRFRIRIEIRCEGWSDFELSLGDRSVAGAGKGSQRVDRPGGSLSRLPSERFVTRVEWLGESVSLVRSNPSVSDAAVFDVSNGGGNLGLDLFFDQSDGRLLAFADGWMLGEIALADEMPIAREVLTLINRGDRIRVDRLDLFHWDGLVPISRRLPNRFTLLSDGTVLDDVIQEWTEERFRVAGKWHTQDKLLRMQSGKVTRPREGCELMLSDGCRIRGQLMASPGGNALWVREAGGNQYSVPRSQVVRFIGNSIGGKESTGEFAELLADEVRLRGRMLAGDDVGATMGWRPDVGKNDLGLVAKPGPEIRSFSIVDGKAAEAKDSYLELRSGDQLPGDPIKIDASGVEFRSGICGKVLIPSRQVRRLSFRRHEPVDQTEASALLSLPRRMKESPPTHLLISAGGDALRGRVVTMDEQVARVEIRGRVRTIPRERVAEIVWLDEQTGEDETCHYVVQAGDHAKLGLVNASFDGTALQGRHSVLGECRIMAPMISSLKFGQRELGGQQQWQLSPVKEPRSFE